MSTTNIFCAIVLFVFSLFLVVFFLSLCINLCRLLCCFFSLISSFIRQDLVRFLFCCCCCCFFNCLNLFCYFSSFAEYIFAALSLSLSHTHTHTHAPTHARTRARAHTHTHSRRACARARTHTHTHTHTHTQSWCLSICVSLSPPISRFLFLCRLWLTHCEDQTTKSIHSRHPPAHYSLAFDLLTRRDLTH